MLCVPILFTGRWSAAVNGKPVQVLNINGGLCGIPLEKGENEVVMTYSLPFFGVSVMVSLIAAAALLAALILWAVRRKKPRMFAKIISSSGKQSFTYSGI